MKTVSGVILFALMIFPSFAGVRGEQGKSAPAIAQSIETATEDELSRLRAEVIKTLEASRERLEKLLAIYERNHKSLAEEFEKRRLFYQQGYISRMELEETERALADTLMHAEEVRRWILEDAIAMTEAVMRDELMKLPPAAPGAYRETVTFIRFDGSLLWSLGDAGKIKQFFSDNFGRALPISAFGQTAVHDRMKFDHRDAMDVAVHPDSTEGRTLMAHLRQQGIPFIAFRGKLPGSATGAHIHVGKPSLRNADR